jgi:hypothetical protein
MIDELRQMRDQLDQLADKLRIHSEQLEAREQQIAQWHEQATESERVQHAERLGRNLERVRVTQLIDIQLDYLKRGSKDSCILRALRRQVEGVLR